jgi:hypothetical protein
MLVVLLAALAVQSARKGYQLTLKENEAKKVAAENDIKDAGEPRLEV